MKQITMRRLALNSLAFDLKWAMRHGFNRHGRWYWRQVVEGVYYLWRWRNRKDLITVYDQDEPVAY